MYEWIKTAKVIQNIRLIILITTLQRRQRTRTNQKKRFWKYAEIDTNKYYAQRSFYQVSQQVLEINLAKISNSNERRKKIRESLFTF